MKPLVVTPHDLNQDNPPPLDGRVLLAEGDSWFTVGSLNLFQNSNLLFELEVQSTTTIVNCAYPGHTLQRMVDGINDRDFDRLLRRRNFARRWDAIVVSAGGNDLIDAAQQPLIDRRGRPTPFADRLLLTPGEAATVNPGATGGAHYVSEDGWVKLAEFLVANFRALASRRDQGPAAGRPLLVHTYSMPTVWPVGTAGASRGWLAPALEAAGIPAQDRQGVADELFGRLRQLLLSLDEGSRGPDALPAVHVFDSAGEVALQPPDPSKKRGPSGDWVNEIHPNGAGYRKLGAAMGAWLDGVLAANP
jgi:lysophospholipase L1-like esterase